MKRATQALLIAPDPIMRKHVTTGLKQITVREGHRDYTPGHAVLYCAIEPWAVEVDITQVRHCQLGEVTEEEWQADGFTSAPDLLKGMRRFYPKVGWMSPVTVIRWHNVRGAYVDSPALHEEHLRGLRRHQHFQPGDRVLRVETGESGVVQHQHIDGTVMLRFDDGRYAELQVSSLEPRLT